MVIAPESAPAGAVSGAIRLSFNFLWRMRQKIPIHSHSWRTSWRCLGAFLRTLLFSHWFTVSHRQPHVQICRKHVSRVNFMRRIDWKHSQLNRTALKAHLENIPCWDARFFPILTLLAGNRATFDDGFGFSV